MTWLNVLVAFVFVAALGRYAAHQILVVAPSAAQEQGLPVANDQAPYPASSGGGGGAVHGTMIIPSDWAGVDNTGAAPITCVNCTSSEYCSESTGSARHNLCFHQGK